MIQSTQAPRYADNLSPYLDGQMYYFESEELRTGSTGTRNGMSVSTRTGTAKDADYSKEGAGHEVQVSQ
jgi:hypothetical protein